MRSKRSECTEFKSEEYKCDTVHGRFEQDRMLYCDDSERQETSRELQRKSYNTTLLHGMLAEPVRLWDM